MQTHPNLAPARGGDSVQTTVHQLLQVTLETLSEVLEHGRATRQDDVLEVVMYIGCMRF